MTPEDERIPYSFKKQMRQVDQRLPQEQTADENINAAVNAAIESDRRALPVNLGFACKKGHRT